MVIIEIIKWQARKRMRQKKSKQVTKYTQKQTQTKKAIALHKKISNLKKNQRIIL